MNCTYCSKGCSDGECIIPSDNGSSSNGTPIFGIKVLNAGDLCEGCMIEEKCYSMGYRISGTFCSGNQSFVDYKSTDSSCDNNFECKSNLCVESECVSGGLFKSMLGWFKRVFTSE